MNKQITKYLVSEMSKENKDRVKLKAYKHSLTIDELILKAIDHYNPDVKCAKSGCKEVTKVATIKHKFKVGADKLEVTVQNVPTVYCNNCSSGEIEQYDMQLSAVLKGLVESEALKKYIETKEKHQKYDFNEVEKMIFEE